MVRTVTGADQANLGPSGFVVPRKNPTPSWGSLRNAINWHPGLGYEFLELLAGFANPASSPHPAASFPPPRFPKTFFVTRPVRSLGRAEPSGPRAVVCKA